MAGLDDVIAAAKAKAAAASTDTAVAVAPAATDNSNVVAYTPRPVQTSLADSLLSALVVDTWLKQDTQNTGLFTFGAQNDKPLKTFDAVIDLSEAKKVHTVRYTLGGGQYQYKKSYDQVVLSDGSGSWADALIEAKRIDPKASVYESAELVFIANEDIKAMTGEVVVKAGERIGKGTSQTEWTPLREFYQKVAQTFGAEGLEGRYLVTIAPRARLSKATGKNHYMMVITNPRPFDEDIAEAA